MEQYDEDSQPEAFTNAPPEEETPASPSGGQPGEKRDIRELLKDKRFMLAAPLFLLGFGGFFYYMIAKGPSSEPSQPVDPLNTTVPMASTDSSSSGKLRLQEEDPSMAMDMSDPTSTMQHGLPQDRIDPYLYGDKRRTGRRASDENLLRVDSAIYARNSAILAPGVSSRNYAARGGSASRESGLPGTLQAGRSSASAPGFLREQDVMLAPDAPDRPLTSADQAYAKSTELQRTVAKQQKLMALLEEYKTDKERMKLVDEDKKTVRKVEDAPLVGSLTPETVQGGGKANTFFGLYTEDQKKKQRRELEEEVGTIRAMVYGDQDVISNGRVKIRLLEPITVRSVVIPAGSIIYGTSSFGTERVTIRLSSIQHESRIFPVNLTAYDMDGMVGIYVPNVQGQAETRQALAQVANGFNINTASGFNTSAVAAAGSAGAQAVIQGARQFVQKKASQQKAHLKNNYYILLRSTSDNDRNQGSDAPSQRGMQGLPGVPGLPALSNLPGMPTGYSPR